MKEETLKKIKHSLDKAKGIELSFQEVIEIGLLIGNHRQLEAERDRLREALKQIEQMSDSGNAYYTISKMKSIATDVLKSGLTDKEVGG